jgi:hypothetical protein
MALGIHQLTYGAIPGSGLTKQPGSLPFQRPPRFVHIEDALESMWDRLNMPDNMLMIYGLLKAGYPVEALARTILYMAAFQGEFTPTLMMLMLPTTIKQIVAIGHKLGVKKMTIRNPDLEKAKFMAKLAEAVQDKIDMSDPDGTGAPADGGQNQLGTSPAPGDQTPPSPQGQPQQGGQSQMFPGIGV